jgi:hypothetical protein
MMHALYACETKVRGPKFNFCVNRVIDTDHILYMMAFFLSQVSCFSYKDEVLISGQSHDHHDHIICMMALFLAKVSCFLYKDEVPILGQSHDHHDHDKHPRSLVRGIKHHLPEFLPGSAKRCYCISTHWVSWIHFSALASSLVSLPTKMGVSHADPPNDVPTDWIWISTVLALLLIRYVSRRSL